MNLLFVTNLYPPHFLGGYERLCALVRDELVRRGHRVSVLTSTHGVENGPDPAEADRDGVHRVLRLTHPFAQRADSHVRLARWRTSAFNRAAALRVMTTVRPDLVFVWSQLRLTLGASLAARELGLPLAYTFNDEHPLGYAAPPFALAPRRLARWLLDGVLLPRLTWHGLDLSHATCISRSLRDRLVAGGVPVSDARIIYQSVPDEHRFAPRDDVGGLADPARVLFLGQLHDYKGVHTLVEAVGRLVASGRRVRLAVAGSGPAPYLARLQALAAPFADHVAFLGAVPPAELPALYRAHDVFVFPSLGVEAFGLTFLEAMASGLPVVASTGGGHAEALVDGENALTFPAEDVSALTAALARVLDDGDLRRRLAAAGLQMVRQRFTTARYVNELEVFLDETHHAPRA